MTLTEMLETKVMAQDDNLLLTPHDAKEVFKRWLGHIPLGAHRDTIMEFHRIRKDLITMVDEPSCKSKDCKRCEVGSVPYGVDSTICANCTNDLSKVINREIAEERAREVKQEMRQD